MIPGLSSGDRICLALAATCCTAALLLAPLVYVNDLRTLNADVRAAVPGCHNGHWKCTAEWQRGDVVVHTETLNRSLQHGK